MFRSRRKPAAELRLIALAGIPQVKPSDDIAALIAEALKRSNLKLMRGDILVVAQKIVSKAERRMIDLATINPSPRAKAWRPRWTRTRAWSS